MQVHQDLEGLVIGRFPNECDMSQEKLLYILDKYPRLKKIPVIYDVDFGHTQPIFTFPLGGQIEFSTEPLFLKVVEK